MAATFCLSAQGTLYIWTGPHFEKTGIDKKGLPLFDGAPIKTRDMHDNECCIPEDAERWRRVQETFHKGCKNILSELRKDVASANISKLHEKDIWHDACKAHCPNIKSFPSRNIKSERPQHKHNKGLVS